MTRSTDPKRLALAKRVRERRLARLVAMYEACNCTWPLDTRRNRHGHGDGCPAIELWQKFHDEDEAAHEELMNP